MISFVKDALQAIQHLKHHYGWRTMLRHLVSPVFEYRRSFMFHISLSEPVPVPSFALNLTRRLATPDDFELLQTIVPRLRAKRFVKKMQAGEVCMIAVGEGRVVGYEWVAFADGITVKELPIKLGPKDAYWWGLFVSRDYRGTRLIPTGFDFLVHYLQEHGYENLYGLVDVNHKLLLRLAPRFGGQAIAQGVSVRFLKWWAHRYTPVE